MPIQTTPIKPMPYDASIITEKNNGFCDITQLLNLYDKLSSRHPATGL
ncbi:hypothetical protein [Serratia fonticola]|nr:hypothetical protein [Serratia fonticola]MEB7883875.1 hypothetical protein [Serratia fonticola]